MEDRIEELAQKLFYFKYPPMSGEGGSDAAYNIKWQDIPELERNSYRKTAVEFYQLFGPKPDESGLLTKEAMLKALNIPIESADRVYAKKEIATGLIIALAQLAKDEARFAKTASIVRAEVGEWLGKNVRAIGGGQAHWFTRAVEALKTGRMPQTESKKCSRCDGSGEICTYHQDRKPYWSTCPNCKGSGTMPDEVTRRER